MRVGEVETLKKEDINFEDKMLELKPENVKGRKEGGVVKQVPVCDYVISQLKYLKENTNGDSDYAFTYWNPRFSRITRVPVRDHFAEIVAACGLKGKVRFHQLRRTVANLLNREGMPIQFTQHLLGHADPNTTKGYLNPDIEPARKAADALGEIVKNKLFIGNADFINDRILPHYPEGAEK